jgi:hypothetical protein
MPCFCGVCVVRSRARTRLPDAAGAVGFRMGMDRATLPLFASSCRFDRDKAKKSRNGSIGPVADVAIWNCAKLIWSDSPSLSLQGSLPFPTLS